MKIRRTLSAMIITVVFTFFSIFSVYAEPADEPALQTATEELSLSTVEPTIVSEETSLRDVNSKHFLMSDGTYAAVAYDMPVHYEQDENWVEIDNTLVPATMIGDRVTGDVVRDSELTSDAATQQAVISRADVAYYENKQNDFIVQLPQTLTTDKPIIINNDGYSLRFFATDVEQHTAAIVSQPKSETEIAQTLDSRLATSTDQAQQAKIQNDIATSVHNIRSVVSYTGVQDDIDINYYVYGQTLKEDIVLHSVPTATSFSFQFAFDGLQPALQEDNSVLFYNDAGEAVFVIATPYMADFDEGYSRDVEVELTSTDTGCIYTLTPDRGWLEASERVYPVTLDPSIQSTQNTNYIHDNGVQQSNPTTNYYNLDRIYVGSGTSSTEGRMYFKLTQWPSAANLNAASINYATMDLSYYPQASWQTGNNITINVARVTSAWDTTTLKWNNQPGVDEFLVDDNDIADARGKTSGADTYNVTAWARAHYRSPSTDYGIRLQPSVVKNSPNRVCYISSDYYTDVGKRPIMTIYYHAYDLYLQQFYDGGYVTRNGSSSASNIATYTNLVSNYYFEVFGIKMHSTITSYISPADGCTHMSSIDEPCSLVLGEVCDYQTDTYHCTNNSLALISDPIGENNIADNTKVVKWTGYIMCEDCPAGGHEEWIGGVTNGERILVHIGDEGDAGPYINEVKSACTLAHELGHTLGCLGDDTDTCSNNTCIMRYDYDDTDNNDDYTRHGAIRDLNTNAYCAVCKDKILNYAYNHL